MDFHTAQRQLQFAKQTPYREVFKSYVGGENLPTLNDESSALVYVVSNEQAVVPDEIIRKLPPAGKDYFRAFQQMRTARCGLFFNRFAVFLKSANDGLLLGFGADDIYYVLAVWDGDGIDFWQPKSNAFNEPVIS